MGEPVVSVIIATRNERGGLAQCLDSLLAQDQPGAALEIIIVDGASTDGTRDVANSFSERHANVRMLDNPAQTTPHAFNIGIRASRGDAIAIVSAHATYAKDYLSKAARYLRCYPIDAVGGRMVTHAGAPTAFGRAIALVLSHRFGVGNATFRTGCDQPTEVDTAAFACYKKAVFDRIGTFNEGLTRNQDIEFNLRLRRSGGRILLAPDMVSYYTARGTISQFAAQAFYNGYWVTNSLRFAERTFSLRHLIPFLFVLALGLGFLASTWTPLPLTAILIAYLLPAVVVSGALARRHGFALWPAVVFAFLTLHLAYGLGSGWGLIRALGRGQRSRP